jgi:hypothetical protein
LGLVRLHEAVLAGVAGGVKETLNIRIEKQGVNNNRDIEGPR